MFNFVFALAESIRDETKKRELKIKLAVSISSGLFIFALLLCCITWRLRQSAKGKHSIWHCILEVNFFFKCLGKTKKIGF